MTGCMLAQPNASILVHFGTGTAVPQQAQVLHCDLQCGTYSEPACWYSLVLQAARRCTTTAQHAQVLHRHLQRRAHCHLTAWSSGQPLPHTATDRAAGPEEQLS